jgi:HK97 gp10 family phage protein
MSKRRPQWSGVEDATRAIRALGELASAAVIESALRQVGEPIRDEMRAAAPVLTGRTAKDISLSTAVEGPEVVLRIGPRRRKGGRAYLVRFIEFGTAHQPARPFMRPVWEEHRPRIAKDFTAALRPAYDRTVRRLERIARKHRAK